MEMATLVRSQLHFTLILQQNSDAAVTPAPLLHGSSATEPAMILAEPAQKRVRNKQAEDIGAGHGTAAGRHVPVPHSLFISSSAMEQVADRIVYYLEYHHITLLSEEDSPEMTFPAVTFCNINRVRVSQLSYKDLLYLAPLVDYEPGMELGFAPAQPSPGDEDEPLNLYRFFNRTCHQLEDMLLSCSYRGEQCGPSDFAAVSSPKAARHGEQLRPASCWIRHGEQRCSCQLAQGQADISALSAATWASRWSWGRHRLQRPAGGTQSSPRAVLAEEVPGTSIPASPPPMGHHALCSPLASHAPCPSWQQLSAV
ncbi:uncharacterized protein [Ciconia boyciana]|uniref:uncharacterized protein n=1 Tax=Ciconia boyciana TaxID=52775 RepID=UPI003BA25A5A